MWENAVRRRFPIRNRQETNDTHTHINRNIAHHKSRHHLARPDRNHKSTLFDSIDHPDHVRANRRIGTMDIQATPAHSTWSRSARTRWTTGDRCTYKRQAARAIAALTTASFTRPSQRARRWQTNGLSLKRNGLTNNPRRTITSSGYVEQRAYCSVSRSFCVPSMNRERFFGSNKYFPLNAFNACVNVSLEAASHQLLPTRSVIASEVA